MTYFIALWLPGACRRMQIGLPHDEPTKAGPRNTTDSIAALRLQTRYKPRLELFARSRSLFPGINRIDSRGR